MFDDDSRIRREIKRLNRQAKRNPLVFARLGECHFRLGDCDRAEPILWRGVQQHPDYLTGWLVLGEVYLYRGLYRDAAECAERGLMIDPRHLGLLQLLLKIRKGQDNEPEVRRLYGDIIALDPWHEAVSEAPTSESEVLPEKPAPTAILRKARTADRNTAQEPAPVQVAETSSEPAPAAAPSEPIPLAAALAEAGRRSLQDYLQDIAGTDNSKPPAPLESIIASDEEPPMFRGKIVTKTLGDLYAGQGQFDEAIIIFEQLAAGDPDNPVYPKRLRELRRQQAQFLQNQKDSEHG
jgi:tetratricopeptide (TPR) repeat protein